jgi:hypothetical protein
MIIKSLARKQPSFDQLVAYCRRDDAPQPDGGGLFARIIAYADRQEVALFALARNLGVPADDRAAVIAAFEQNYALLPARRNGNALYHEVLSLPAVAGLAHRRQVAMLTDLAGVYAAQRAPDCLVYGVIHTDTDHLHCHLVISANLVGSSRRHRLSKRAFTEIQRQVERYRLEQYPELGHEALYTQDQGKAGKQRVSETALTRRTGQPSRKDHVRQAVDAACRAATSQHALNEALARAGLALYCRGMTWGVQDAATGRKYRLQTLGVQTGFTEARARFALADRRAAQLRALTRPDQGRERER